MQFIYPVGLGFSFSIYTALLRCRAEVGIYDDGGRSPLSSCRLVSQNGLLGGVSVSQAVVIYPVVFFCWADFIPVASPFAANAIRYIACHTRAVRMDGAGLRR